MWRSNKGRKPLTPEARRSQGKGEGSDVTGTQGEWQLNVEELPPHPGRKRHSEE